MVLTGVFYLIIDIYYFFVISMFELTYSFIYHLNAYAISLYHLNYCFLMSFEIYKGYR